MPPRDPDPTLRPPGLEPETPPARVRHRFDLALRKTGSLHEAASQAGWAHPHITVDAILADRALATPDVTRHAIRQAVGGDPLKENEALFMLRGIHSAVNTAQRETRRPLEALVGAATIIERRTEMHRNTLAKLPADRSDPEAFGDMPALAPDPSERPAAEADARRTTEALLARDEVLLDDLRRQAARLLEFAVAREVAEERGVEPGQGTVADLRNMVEAMRVRVERLWRDVKHRDLEAAVVVDLAVENARHPERFSLRDKVREVKSALSRRPSPTPQL